MYLLQTQDTRLCLARSMQSQQANPGVFAEVSGRLEQSVHYSGEHWPTPKCQSGFYQDHLSKRTSSRRERERILEGFVQKAKCWNWWETGLISCFTDFFGGGVGVGYTKY